MMTFLQYFNDVVVQVSLVERSSSVLMRSIAWLLGAANIFRKVFKMPLYAEGEFLANYVTTIGRKVYASPKWEFDKKDSPLVVHELTHVLQWSLTYIVLYIFSSTWRARFEADAFHSEVMCFGLGSLTVESRAQHLVPYGVPLAEAMELLTAASLDTWKSPTGSSSRIIAAFRTYEALHG